MWTKRDQAYWDELMIWEQQLAAAQNRAASEAHFFTSQAAAVLPEETQVLLAEKVDEGLQSIYAFMQKTQLQNEACERVLAVARVFDDEIQTLAHMRCLSIDQLHYISSQQTVRSRFMAVVQGALTGTGKLLPMAADVLSLPVIQLHVIETTAMSYGFDLNKPFERENVLHVLYTAMLPKQSRIDGWARLITEVEEGTFYIDGSWSFNESMLREPLQYMIKLAAVRGLRRQKLSGIPLLSMGIGIGSSWQIVNETALLAERYYQYRYLHEKKNRS
ncbi:EcsC family protein [Domibacillus robiginosus]|uniref:EcsC family protein n=1 Tax=Domibacillus robiginosus TaxID=1071054 RepID=UPI00067AE334|nr:EcsC family protein [Domibacillus robiginosus]